MALYRVERPRPGWVEFLTDGLAPCEMGEVTFARLSDDDGSTQWGPSSNRPSARAIHETGPRRESARTRIRWSRTKSAAWRQA